MVTPCVGVWIETDQMAAQFGVKAVTPCVGVWIETEYSVSNASYPVSHPAWVCGLKRKHTEYKTSMASHTLRGCVD